MSSGVALSPDSYWHYNQSVRTWIIRSLALELGFYWNEDQIPSTFISHSQIIYKPRKKRYTFKYKFKHSN